MWWYGEVVVLWARPKTIIFSFNSNFSASFPFNFFFPLLFLLRCWFSSNAFALCRLQAIFMLLFLSWLSIRRGATFLKLKLLTIVDAIHFSFHLKEEERRKDQQKLSYCYFQFVVLFISPLPNFQQSLQSNLVGTAKKV